MADSQKIFEALVAIRADSVAFKSDLDRVTSVLTAKLGSMQSIAKQLAPVLSVAGIGAFLKSVVDAGDHIQDLGDRTGISTQLLSGLRPILVANGTDLDSFAKAMVKVQRSLGDLSGEGKIAADTLRAIHLDPAALAKDSPDAFIKKLSESLGQIEDQNKRLAVSYRLMGRSGAEQVPALRELAGNFEKIKNSGLDPQTIRDLDQFADGLKKLGIAAQNLVAGPLSGLLNILLQIAGLTSEQDKLIDNLNAITAKSVNVAGQIAAANALRARGVTTGIASEKIYNALIAERDDLLEKSAALTGKLNQQKTPKAGIDVQLPDRAAISKLEGFLEGLSKEADHAKISLTKLLSGDEAAKAEELNAAFARFKQTLAKEGVALPAGAEAQFNAIRDSILASNDALEKQKLIIDQVLISGRLGREQEAEDAANREAITKAQQELNAATLEGQRIRGQIDPELQAQLARNIEATLGKEKEQAAFMSEVFGPAFDEAGAKVEALTRFLEGLKTLGFKSTDAPVIKVIPEFDRAKLDRDLAELDKTKVSLEIQAVLLGPDIDTIGPQIDALKRQLEDKLKDFKTPELALADPRVQEVAGNIRGLQQSKEFADLRKEMDLVAKQAQIFGSEFDGVGASIDAVRGSIVNLLRGGLDPLDPKIQQLKDALDGLKGISVIQKGFDSLADGIGEFFKTVGDNTETFGARIKSIVRGIVVDIRDEITKQFIVKPIKDFFAGLVSDLQKSLQQSIGSGGTGGGILSSLLGGLTGGGTAAAPAAGGSANQAQAVAAIQSTASLAETSLQTLASAVTVSLQSEEAASIAGIKAVEASALAAIAAKLGGGGAAGADCACIDDLSGNIKDAFESLSDSGGTAIERAADSTVRTARAALDSFGNAAEAGIRGEAGAAVAGIRSIQSVATASISQALSMIGGGGGGGGGWGQLIGSAISTGLKIFTQLATTGHSGGLVTSEGIKRFHGGGRIGGDMPPEQLASLVQAFDTGGAVGKQLNLRAFGKRKPGERMILAEDGEFIVRKEMARMPEIAKQLKAINAGEFRGIKSFHSGGVVTDMADQGQNFALSHSSISQAAMPTMLAAQPVASTREKREVPKISVDIRGGIIPERPGMKKEDVIKVFIEDYKNFGASRTMIRGDR